MKVQVYDEDNMARVFDRTGNGICDVWPRGPQTLEEVDAALKRIRMRRVGEWERHAVGGYYEARARFDSRRK